MWESKVAPLSGVAVAVLFAVSAVLINNYEFMPSQERVASFYAGDSVRIMIGSYCGALSAFFLLWFAGSVRKAIGSVSDRLGTVAFGGAVMAAATIALGYLAHVAGAERAMLHDEIDPGVAASLFDLAGLTVGTGASFGLAALIGGFAVVAFRGGRHPRWLAWVSALTALGLVSPVNYLFAALAIVWIPVVGVLLYRSGEATEPVESEPITV